MVHGSQNVVSPHEYVGSREDKQSSSMLRRKGSVFRSCHKESKRSAFGTKVFVEERTFGQDNVHKTKSAS